MVRFMRKKIENVGRTSVYKISFWNCEDQMNPLFTIYTQHEITTMKFHPLTRHILICGTATGQVFIINLLKNFYEIISERYNNRSYKISQSNIPYEVKTS